MNESSSQRPVCLTEPVYTLSVASRLSGVPLHSIRQYIDKGLVLPYKKDSNRHLFSEMDIRRLKFIEIQLHEKGLNIAGIRAVLALIPCWSIRDCDPVDRKNCSAYTNDSLPCWEASEKGKECRNEDCRECEVYKIPGTGQGLKELFKTLLT